MSLLLIDGKVAFFDGKPLIEPDPDCCCSECCDGMLPCCQAVVSYPDFGVDCGGGNHRVTISWQWTLISTIPSPKRRFTWSIVDNDSGGGNAVDGMIEGFEPPCSLPVGAWTAQQTPWPEGVWGTLKKFDYVGRPLVGYICDWSDATVTISQTDRGYKFAVQGVQVHNWSGCLCGDMNREFIVECD